MEEIILTTENIVESADKILSILVGGFAFISVDQQGTRISLESLDRLMDGEDFGVFVRNNHITISSDYGMRFIELDAKIIFSDLWFFVFHKSPGGNDLEWHFYKGAYIRT